MQPKTPDPPRQWAVLGGVGKAWGEVGSVSGGGGSGSQLAKGVGDGRLPLRGGEKD